ncbi:hypothetical protein HOLleu_13709 [Holothuria leucospilota]|uniref:Uncharacterized protein n=1 Tax=Holothuria leucospilota TaxID=206669 RepID=A0A9Q1C6P3_HOLLE|nr:hypothetical protein HOLleu_13709 [Holothuria leucospilota]
MGSGSPQNREKCIRTPSIEELVEFIVDAAKEANYPIYGKLSFRSKESAQNEGKRDKPFSSENIACKEDLIGWSHLHDLELPSVGPEKVGLLICQDTPEALTPLEARMGEVGQPCAIRTKLGWCVNGPMGQGRVDRATAYFVSHGEDLDFQIKKFWKIDSNDPLSHDMREMSVADKKAVSVWEETVCLKQGHYELGIPFKETPFKLPNNREVAEQRLWSLGRHLKRDSSLYEQYRQDMEDMLIKMPNSRGKLKVKRLSNKKPVAIFGASA